MIIIRNPEEQEIVRKIRAISDGQSVPALSEKVLELTKKIADLDIQKSKREEDFARQERELRHMIGLEKKRQEVETEQAKREAVLGVREENLKAERDELKRQLTFNTERFEKMETYLKDMFKSVMERLPNVNVELRKGGK